MRPLLFCFVLMLSSLAALAEPAQQISLAEVGRFDSSLIGFGATPSPNFEAFQMARARGAEAAPLFEKLLKQGSPAARLYSAIGLYGLDRARGVAALESLRSDQARVETMEGCMMHETTVGGVAVELLAGGGEALRSYLP
jgi:hypothetical protein